MSKYNFFYKLEKKFLRIWLIILDAELPLGSLYTVQRFLSCLSASSPKRLQILFSILDTVSIIDQADEKLFQLVLTNPNPLLLPDNTSSAIAEKPRCSLLKLWQRYKCEN